MWRIVKLNDLDIIGLNANLSTPSSVSLDESGIAWSSDSTKFKQAFLNLSIFIIHKLLTIIWVGLTQVTGFKSAVVHNSSVSCSAAGLPSNCKFYYDSSSGLSYRFYYPSDSSVQYLYETYPDQISPIDGVTDEHFKVWMRTAG